MNTAVVNPFVDYLNSLHNDDASNQNAIAEMQISSPYFDTTQVKRPLVDFIARRLSNGDFVILTGHAGDGKTTLLAQVLAAMGNKQSALQLTDDVVCSTQTVHYIKDFSELTEEKQTEQLLQCFHRQGAAILIANTGPLLKTFKRIGAADYEATLLDVMDKPAGGEIAFEKLGRVFLLNIARIDNTDFIHPYLKNLIAFQNWEACSACPNASRCPIFFNRQLLSDCFERAAGFIQRVYLWLEAYDHHATIRQITAHLTYAITGGLCCKDLNSRHGERFRLRYLFSNLFFGSDGCRELSSAIQIKAIQFVTAEKFDLRPTSRDYALFNQKDYATLFPASLAALFDVVFRQHRYDTNMEQQIVKRAYLLFGLPTWESDKPQTEETFSEWFEYFFTLQRTGERPKRQLKEHICKAINTLFLGETADDHADQMILTLRRNNEQTSNVQLLAGRISTSDVYLKCEAYETISEGKRYRLVLCIGEKHHPITLPLLNYFSEINRGIIMTDIDPLLSNGIDSLKAHLLSSHTITSEDNEVSLVFLAGNRWMKRTLYISDHHIEHDS